MPLSAGEKLGPYEILAPLGGGGMGDVYRARDSGLNRDVAIKVLPAARANNAQYVARFERQARVLASLNHPNIAHIYGLEQNAIVMELVEGEEPRGPLPVEDATKIARQIADALKAAHDQGVVHGDLKPANIKVARSSVVKVLNFGLGIDADPSSLTSSADAATVTTRGTQTSANFDAFYIAPERAAGKPVDTLADIWAFGTVLYEMLAGGRLFEAETPAVQLDDALTKEIDLSKLPAAVPPAIRELLARCLQRDPRKRLRDIGEAQMVLSQDFKAAGPAPGAAKRRPFLPWAAPGTALLLVVVAFAWQLSHPSAAYLNCSYSEFLRQIADKQVTSVTVIGGNAGAVEANYQLRDGKAAQTVLPSEYTEALHAMMEGGVDIKIQRPTRESFRLFLNSTSFAFALGICVGLMIGAFPSHLRHLARAAKVMEVLRKFGLVDVLGGGRQD